MKLKYKIMLLFVLTLSILSLLTGIYSIYTMKEKVIESARSKLKSDISLTEKLLDSIYPGDFNIKSGNLYKGDFNFKDDYTFVDMIGEMTGDTVTIFNKDTRISTNVIDSDGNRAINTKISEEIGEEVLNNSNTYTGIADVVGTLNQAIYKPIKDSSGKVIGILYVGVPNTFYDEIAKDFAFSLVLFAISGLIISIIIIWYFSKKIFSPLISLESSTKKMAEGDLNAKVDIITKDEIGSLSKSFNIMLDNMNNTLVNILQASREVNINSRNLCDSSNSIAEGASEQAATIEELTASIIDISEKLHKSTLNANNARDFSKSVIDTATIGNTNISSMLNSMNDISLTSKDIKKIIKTIDNIAFQTNILALNASVEAARAGSYGRGFSVVAGEVRTLSIQAAAAAKETSILIENSLKTIEDGKNIADVTSKNFKEIEDGLFAMVDSIEDIAIFLDSQSNSMDQISAGISQISDVVQNNSAISEESAAASIELNDHALRLNKEVLNFKLQN